MNDQPAPVDSAADSETDRGARNGWRTFGIVVITVVVTLAAAYWVVPAYLFPDLFTPVVLNQPDQQQLENKLRRLAGGSAPPAGTALEPEPYSEAGASRDIEFSERELNALLARNTDLANRLAIDLSQDLASARLLLDVDPGFPILGGRTIEVTGGMELRVENGRPSAVLRGISLWGVPLPNAWLGNLKNVDLFREFHSGGGFWQALGDGLESIRVAEGRLYIRLRE